MLAAAIRVARFICCRLLFGSLFRGRCATAATVTWTVTIISLPILLPPPTTQHGCIMRDMLWTGGWAGLGGGSGDSIFFQAALKSDGNVGDCVKRTFSFAVGKCKAGREFEAKRGEKR